MVHRSLAWRLKVIGGEPAATKAHDASNDSDDYLTPTEETPAA